MSWIAMSRISAAVSALVSILDKTVIYRYVRSPLTLPLLIGILQTGFGLAVLIIVRVPSDATWGATGAALLSGMLYGINGQLVLRVLYTQEVSRTVPVTQAAPIFVAILALIFLSESISAVQWLAIIGIVMGSALLTVRTEGGVSGIFLHRSFYPLMLAAFSPGQHTSLENQRSMSFRSCLPTDCACSRWEVFFSFSTSVTRRWPTCGAISHNVAQPCCL